MGRLPAGYQELLHIESTGTQWIDTGIVPFDGVVAKFDAFIPRSMSSRTFFGVGGDDGWGVYMGQSNLWDNYDDGHSTSISSGYTGPITVVKNGKTSTFTTSSGTINYTHSRTYPKDTRTISLFRKKGSDRSYGIFQLFLFSLSDQNGDFLWLGVPCKRLFDGAIGMFDLVSQSFFGNSGTGSFIGGVPIIEPTWGSGLAQVTQKELLARRFAITPRRLWLYNYGNECVDVTGGWEIGKASYVERSPASGNITKENTYIYLAPNTSNRPISIITRNAINLNKYTKLCAVADLNYQYYEGSYSTKCLFIRSIGNSGDYGTNDNFIRAQFDPYNQSYDWTTQKVTIAVDELSSRYIGVLLYRNGANPHVRLRQVWLE